MKPDWKDAPEWAKWLAQDKSCEWWWYESKPGLAAYVDCFTNGDDEKSRSAPAIPVATEWKESLEPRPAIEGESCE